MSYKTTSIKDLIRDIDANKVYLPALQRKFVWEKGKITLLFDSIMRGYPIGAFLLWRLRHDKADQYVFYEFLKEYDQRDPYNRRKTGLFVTDEIIGVLDGQQRLSSLYLGLMGTHTEKALYKRRTNNAAYEKTSLYLNLLRLPYSVDADKALVLQGEPDFDFRFLTDNEAKKPSRVNDGTTESLFWFKVGSALSWNEDPDYEFLIDGLISACITDEQRQRFKETRRFVRKSLEGLHSRLRDTDLLSYFEVQKDDLEDILKIFVRVNSAVSPLSRTDLLFSTIVATWDNGREEIETCLKSINAKGDKFNFSNDFLMRCCLVLSDGPVVFKVQSFKADNVEKIRKEWDNINRAVTRTVDLLVEFGFNGTTLTSQNAIIIVAYYLYRGGDLSDASKKGIQKYLSHALLKGLYGSGQDQLITALRNAFRSETRDATGAAIYQQRHACFPFDELVRMELPGGRSLAITIADLERFLEIGKSPATFFTLSLLYPHLRFQEIQFHQDHIHPAAGFDTKNLDSLGIPPEQRTAWTEKRDRLPNLQLMEGRENISKNKTPIESWLKGIGEPYSSAFRSQNYFPENTSLDFKNFLEFYEKRKSILREKLRAVLAISSNPEIAQPEDGSENPEPGDTALPALGEGEE